VVWLQTESKDLIHVAGFGDDARGMIATLSFITAAGVKICLMPTYFKDARRNCDY
jgi:hypothetical protein